MSSSTGLHAEIDVGLGALRLSVDLRVPPGQTVAVVGPNGAGKTTLLRTLAGLVAIDAGSISLDGRALDEPDTGTFVPPEERQVGVVFQDHLLLPHLSALDNVAFGLRCRGVGRAEARAQARGWLDHVGLGGQAASKPSELSGGQAQRVALARALAVSPALLLLDEPLAALDVSARATTRRDLGRHLEGHTGVRVVVTHDPVDAAAIADRVVVVEAGRLVQEGTLPELTQRPRSRYVADLVGMNLLSGRASGGAVVVGSVTLTATEAPEGDVVVVIPPRAVTLALVRPEGTARNVWSGTIDHLEPVGERVRVRATGPITVVAEVTPAAVAALGLRPGVAVWVAVKATEVEVLPA